MLRNQLEAMCVTVGRQRLQQGFGLRAMLLGACLTEAPGVRSI